MAEPTDPKIKKILRRFDALKTLRANYEPDWEKLCTYVVPQRNIQYRTPGSPRTIIHDSTAKVSCRRLAAAVHGFLTNPASKWMALCAEQAGYESNEEVRAWLQDATNRMLAVFASPRYGFMTQIHETYTDWVGMGTGIFFVKQDNKKDVSFKSIPLSQCYIEENEDGIVDTLYRKWCMTPDRAWETFGDDTPEDIRKLSEKGSVDDLEFLHAVQPRRVYDPERFDSGNMPWSSDYIWLSGKKSAAIGESKGFKRFPYACPRWVKNSGEVYGTSPGSDVMEAIQGVNAEKRTTIMAAELMVDPPWAVPNDTFMNFNLKPRGINYYQAGTGEKAYPMISGGKVEIGELIIEQDRKEIREAYWRDILELPDFNRATTEEVRARQAQRLQFASPVLSRGFTELLGPVIQVTFYAMVEKEMFAPVPAALKDINLKVEYTSPLALSQRASEQFNVQQFVGLLAPIANIKPEILEKINLRGFSEWAASVTNVPQQILLTDALFAQKLQGADQARAAAAAAQTAEPMANAAKSGAQAMQLSRQAA